MHVMNFIIMEKILLSTFSVISIPEVFLLKAQTMIDPLYGIKMSRQCGHEWLIVCIHCYFYSCISLSVVLFMVRSTFNEMQPWMAEMYLVWLLVTFLEYLNLDLGIMDYRHLVAYFGNTIKQSYCTKFPIDETSGHSSATAARHYANCSNDHRFMDSQ
jgi:hypothetical protein